MPMNIPPIFLAYDEAADASSCKPLSKLTGDSWRNESQVSNLIEENIIQIKSNVWKLVHKENPIEQIKESFNYEITRFLLGKALAHYIEQDSDPEMVKLFLKAGASPNGHDWTLGREPTLAKVYRNRTLMELLVENGADVNERNPLTGNTPLFAAASNCDSKSVAFLITHGADVRMKNRFGFDALTLAKGILNYSKDTNPLDTKKETLSPCEQVIFLLENKNKE